VVGDIVENFILEDQNGNEFDLYQNLDKKILLIFYPKDNSTVCSKQLSNYQLNLKLFEENYCKPVGINIEDTRSHKKFCAEKGIEFPLLFDKNKIISKKLSALNFIGMNKRRLVLIGNNKEILFEENISYLDYPTSKEIITRFRNSKILPAV